MSQETFNTSDTRPGYILVDRAALEAGLDPYELALYVHILAEVGLTPRSYNRLGEAASMSRRKVIEVVKALVAKGLITIQREGPGPLELRVLGGAPHAPVHHVHPPEGAKSAPPLVQNLHPIKKGLLKESSEIQGGPSDTPVHKRPETPIQVAIREALIGVPREQLTKQDGKACGYVAGYARQIDATPEEIRAFAADRRAHNWRVTWMAYRDHFHAWVRERRGTVAATRPTLPTLTTLEDL